MHALQCGQLPGLVRNRHLRLHLVRARLLRPHLRTCEWGAERVLGVWSEACHIWPAPCARAAWLPLHLPALTPAAAALALLAARHPHPAPTPHTPTTSQCPAVDFCSVPAANSCDGCQACRGGYRRSADGKECSKCSRDNCQQFATNSCRCDTCADGYAAPLCTPVSGAAARRPALLLLVLPGQPALGLRSHILAHS